ncbi:MAG TPA: ABC transporter substrate-binding protein [Microlunatus sp.]|jgi:oligopeptide transport system substrate-binding protein|nr:ABC transporter substrate-binding protein [Microlunatus sp.]
MRGRARAVLATGITTIALLAAACGGGGGETSPGTEEGGQTGGEITVAGCTPENPLIPGNTSETCGGDMIQAMTSMLVEYNTENAAPEMDIAESIETSDNKMFTVKLKPYKFQDGTEVTAKSFVDAWNYTAYGPNGQAGSYFYAPVAGYADVQCPDEECKGKPKAETMSGLKVVDDKTFTIETSEPVSNLPVRLGYSAFAPLPEAFFADKAAFEKQPIGAGPFKVDSISNTETVMSKFADFSGKKPANADKLTFRIYQDPAAAYADAVAGSLDYIDDSNIPQDQFIGDAYKSDFPDRTAQRESLVISWIWFSSADPQLKDKPELRKAISRAIDRDLIAKEIFQGTRTSATGWVSPGVDGFKADTCGDSCKFDAAAAKTAFEAAGGYEGTLTMTYNADSPNKAWSEAVCNSIKNTLGIECVAVPTVDFATFNKKIDANELKGIFRGAWQADYPSIENYMTPLYAKGAWPPGSNWGRYDNPEFDALLAKAAAAPTTDEANTMYQQAEAMLAEDFPNAPLWYYTTTSAWSDRVTDVQVNAFGVLDYATIKVK